MGKMTVYHGSHTAVKKPEILKGRNTKDFGPGFYCTVIREQAERWARRYDSSIVNTYTVRLNTDLDILEFKEMNEEWLDFIIACRSGKPHAHDLVPARFKYPTHQINFCTQAALACLEYVSSEEVVPYDRT